MTRWKRWGLAGVLALAAGGAAVYFAHRPGVSPIPEISADTTDRATLRLLERKRRAAVASPSDGTAWGELGMAFDAAEQNPEAIACYDVARDRSPDDPRWPYLLAKLLARRAGPADADHILHLSRAAANGSFPTPAHRACAHLTLADALADRGQVAEATALYQRVSAEDPGNAAAAYALALQATNRGDPTAAVAQLTRHAKNPYTRKKASAALAVIYRRTNQTADAAGYEAAARLPPDRPRPDPFLDELSQYRRRPDVLADDVTRAESVGAYAQAATTARRLVDFDPTAEHQLVYGRTLTTVKNYDAAIATLEDAVSADPTSAPAHGSLGAARFGKAEKLASLGHREPAKALYEEAIRSFQKAVELNADYAPGYLSLAKARIALGQYDAAESAVRSYLARRPAEWEAHAVLGDVLAATARKAEAIQSLEQAVRLSNPDEARPRNRLAELRK